MMLQETQQPAMFVTNMQGKAAKQDLNGTIMVKKQY